jgi:hypothetical protein
MSQKSFDLAVACIDLARQPVPDTPRGSKVLQEQRQNTARLQHLENGGTSKPALILPARVAKPLQAITGQPANQ